MKQPNLLLKLAVVASSLLLVGGLVSYRAGVFGRFGGAVSRPADAASPTTPEEGAFFGGSKSAEIFHQPTTPAQPPPGTTKPAPTIMGGSKSGIQSTAQSLGF